MRAIEGVLTRLQPRIEALPGDSHDGQDLFEDVAVACLKRENEYDWFHPEIDGRVMRIAQNLNIRRMRRDRVRENCKLPDDDLVRDRKSRFVEEQFHHWEGAILCRRAVQQLAPRDRAIGWWHVVRRERFGQIARRLSLNESTVRCCCHRALKKLRQNPEIVAFASA